MNKENKVLLIVIMSGIGAVVNFIIFFQDFVFGDILKQSVEFDMLKYTLLIFISLIFCCIFGNQLGLYTEMVKDRNCDEDEKIIDKIIRESDKRLDELEAHTNKVKLALLHDNHAQEKDNE